MGVEVAQYQPTTADLTRDEVVELTTLTKGTRAGGQPWVIERLNIGPDGYDVTPGHYVGRFSLRSGRRL